MQQSIDTQCNEEYDACFGIQPECEEMFKNMRPKQINKPTLLQSNEITPSKTIVLNLEFLPPKK